MLEIPQNPLARISRKELIARGSYVNGQWKEAGERRAVLDPASDQEIAHVTWCSTADVLISIDSAELTFPDWRKLTPLHRSKVLRRWAALIREHLEDLATIITCEQGKPIAESRGEVEYGAGFVDWFAEEGQRAYGETIPCHIQGSALQVIKQPVGIAAIVTPWNFPLAMITRKAAAALAAGCPVIVKPAPETPLTGLALAKLAEEAGVPPGAFQVLIGDAVAITKTLLQDSRVRAFSFTGSTSVGRLLLEQSAATVKKVSLELGGHAPFIVFDDADPKLAASGCVAAKFATSGQDCLAANRIYVQRGIYKSFVESFCSGVRKLKTGHGLDPEIDIGPMTKRSVAEKCRLQIQDAVRLGADLVLQADTSHLGSNFIPPTVLANVTESMLIAQEETFGPVAAILPFDTEDEVLTRANQTELGLASYIYTNDLRRAMRASNRLEYGMVGINTPTFTGPPIPFGGWKQSGLGREGSRHGLNEYMQLKYTCFGDLVA